MSQNLIQKTYDYVKLRTNNEIDAHDWFHVERVWRMAKYLQSKEGGDLELIELSALLHNLGDNKQIDALDKIKGPLILRGMMDVLEIEENRQRQIIQVISESQYSGDSTKSPSSIEGKIVQDSDFLDSVGALGIARSCLMGGIVGRPLHNPGQKARKKITKGDYLYHKKDGTTFNYFYEKLLKLPKMMNTETAKKIAEKRAIYIENFIEEFISEWEGKR